MNAKKRSKLRDKVQVKLMQGPYVFAQGWMTANQAISFRANPFQIFKDVNNS